MAASGVAELGIDVGCGPMNNRPYFRSERYIGVDLDVERLVGGRRRFPEALAVAMRIEQDCGIAGDFVLCVQMFVNRHFPAEQTLAAARALVQMTRPGGTLIFNIARRNLPWESDIDRLLQGTFDDVHKFRYGVLSGRDFGPLATPIALATLALPVLRRGDQADKVYYRCRGKISGKEQP